MVDFHFFASETLTATEMGKFDNSADLFFAIFVAAFAHVYCYVEDLI